MHHIAEAASEMINLLSDKNVTVTLCIDFQSASGKVVSKFNTVLLLPKPETLDWVGLSKFGLIVKKFKKI